MAALMAMRLSICVLKVTLGRGAAPAGRLSAFSTPHFSQVLVRAGVGGAKRSRLRPGREGIAGHHCARREHSPVPARLPEATPKGRHQADRGGGCAASERELDNRSDFARLASTCRFRCSVDNRPPQRSSRLIDVAAVELIGAARLTLEPSTPIGKLNRRSSLLAARCSEAHSQRSVEEGFRPQWRQNKLSAGDATQPE